VDNYSNNRLSSLQSHGLVIYNSINVIDNVKKRLKRNTERHFLAVEPKTTISGLDIA